YHRAVLGSGVRLEYDSAFRWPAGQPNPTLQLLIALLPDYPDQIMLGMDAARRSYWMQYGGSPGMTFLYTTWVETMRNAGIDDAHIRRLFQTTPAQAYTFTR